MEIYCLHRLIWGAIGLISPLGVSRLRPSACPAELHRTNEEMS